MDPISEQNRLKLEEFLDNNDFPVYVDYGGIENLQEWHLQSGERCSFCPESSSYRNNELNAYACESCVGEISDGEIDPVNPGDHKLSQYIRDYLCRWIDKEWCDCCQVEVYFDEYQITHNKCCFCSQKIKLQEGDYVSVVGNCLAVAHTKCADLSSWNGFFTKEDYDNIIDTYLLKHLE